MEAGGLQRLQGRGIGSIELLAVLPILPMVSCFSNCGFGDGFVSCWLWDPMGIFWGPLIFLFRVVSCYLAIRISIAHHLASFRISFL
jgi:hypothetical protein